MFFGGSSVIHLLAGHPRVVAVIGVGTLAESLLQTPFGTPNIPGVAAHMAQLEQAQSVQESDITQIVARAERLAQANAAAASPARLSEIIAQTLRQCGRGCADVSGDAVLSNTQLLQDVLLLDALHNEHELAARRSNKKSDGPNAVPTNERRQ